MGSFPPLFTRDLSFFFFLRHVWGPEQNFWLNVTCKENAAKVRYDSLFAQEGKADICKGIAFSTLAW